MIDANSTPPVPPAAWIGSVLIALAVLLATAPTLSQLEFSGSMENLNVATVLEIRRTGHWLIPTLEGDARLNKPPLTAWVTALFVPPEVVQRLSEQNPALRDAAYRDLAFRARLAPLIETCLTTLLVAAIAAVTFGGSTPFLAAAAYATSLLVLKLGRAATTDVQMTLWIAVAQFGIALVLWRGQRWLGCAIAGIATGLAIMSKGPVCLLFLFLPVIVLWAVRSLRGRDEQPSLEVADDSPSRSRLRACKNILAPCAVGTLLALAIGLPWFIYVYLKSPQVIGGWTTEVTRVGATENASSNPVFYLCVFPLLTPWLPWAIVGMIGAWGAMRRGAPPSNSAELREGASEQDLASTKAARLRLRSRIASPAIWFLLAGILPLLVMSFFPDRKDRYALPAMIPLALLAAYGIQTLLAGAPSRIQKTLLAIHYLTLAILVLALPIAAATVLKTVDGRPWLSSPIAGVPMDEPNSFAILGSHTIKINSLGGSLEMNVANSTPLILRVFLLIIGGSVILLAGLLLQRRRPRAFVGATVLLLLGAQAVVMHGYSQSRSGRSEMKPLADAIRLEFPEAKTVLNARHDRKRISVDLAIYLNQSTQRRTDWPTMPLQSPPAVAVVPQRAGEPDPVPPPGWRVLARVPRDSDWWWAWVQSAD